MRREIQNTLILAHIRRGWLSPLDALDLYGCNRLAARIHELARDGHDIERRIVGANGKRWAEYRLAVPRQLELQLCGDTHGRGTLTA